MIDKLEIAKFLSKQAISRFSGKIAIITVYGSVALGTSNMYSDVDMFAIIDNEAETTLPWNFVLQGYTIEFWKMDWQTAENMALGKIKTNPWTVSASLFVNSKILYVRSESDGARFNKLREKTKRSEDENLREVINNFNSGYSSIELLRLAQQHDDLLSAKWAAWGLINFSVICLSLLNNVFLLKNWGKNLQELLNLPILPENFSNLVRNLITSSNFDEMISTGRGLLSGIRTLVLERQRQVSIPIFDQENTLCKDYTALKSYLNKIRSACRSKNIFAASYAATEIQLWIAQEIAASKGKLVDIYNFNSFEEVRPFYNYLKLPDLMEKILKQDFQQIEQTVDIIDSRIQQYCVEQNSNPLVFKNWNELKNYF